MPQMNVDTDLQGAALANVVDQEFHECRCGHGPHEPHACAAPVKCWCVGSLQQLAEMWDQGHAGCALLPSCLEDGYHANPWHRAMLRRSNQHEADRR